ncbi:MAG: SGNH/GDSL hydrolase family protein [Isosphaeraceae bacterium]
MFLARLVRFLKAVQTVWSMIGVTIVAIVLTEAALRLAFAVKDRLASAATVDPRLIREGYGGETWPMQHDRELRALADRWEPYVYFRQKPFAGQTITINADGLRRTWAPVESTERTGKVHRLLMLGGSTLWGYGARDERTIPSLVARRLYERGYRVEVRNLAEIGYVSTQEAVALVREVQAGYRPDLVILYDGVNDTTSALLEGEAGVTTNERNRRTEFNILQSPGRLAGSLVMRVVRDSASFRLAGVIAHRVVGPAAVPLVGSSATDRKTLVADVVRRYCGNLEIVEKLGREYGFDALFYWQPVVFDKEGPTPFEADEARKIEWARGFFGEVYRSIRESSELRGATRFHDLSRMFAGSKELVFIDYCHTTEAANERVAATIADDVAKVLPSAAAASPVEVPRVGR